MRVAMLHEFKLNGQYCVTFREVKGDTESLSFGCYPTEHKALLEVSVFEHRDIFKRLA